MFIYVSVLLTRKRWSTQIRIILLKFNKGAVQKGVGRLWGKLQGVIQYPWVGSNRPKYSTRLGEANTAVSEAGIQKGLCGEGYLGGTGTFSKDAASPVNPQGGSQGVHPPSASFLPLMSCHDSLLDKPNWSQRAWQSITQAIWVTAQSSREKGSEWFWGQQGGHPYLYVSPLNFFPQKSGGCLL